MTRTTNDPLAQFPSLPGALPTQPVSHAKDGRDITMSFLEDAHKYTAPIAKWAGSTVTC